MKILAISDVPSKALWDYGTREHLEGIDLILSCGDLPQKYLEYLTNFTAAPILYVHGNHDGSYRENEPGGCICVDDSVYVWKGLRIMGLGGSIRYNNREDSFQYTEREMRRRVRKLWRKAHHVGGIDLLLTHSPAAGLNDSTDRAHKGFACFNDLMDEYEPQWFVHGHVHLNYDAKLPRVCTRGKTTVINATERYVFEIPDPDPVIQHYPFWKRWFDVNEKLPCIFGCRAAFLRFKMEPCVGTDNLPQNRCGVLCSRRKEDRKSYSSSLPETLLIT